LQSGIYIKLNWNNEATIRGVVKNKQFEGTWIKGELRGSVIWKDENSFEKLSMLLGSTGCSITKSWKGTLDGVAVNITDFIVDTNTNKISAKGTDSRGTFTLSG
jgi:type II secretory pathway component PulJ